MSGLKYPGPLREVISEVLGMQRVELTVDDVEMVADSIEKSEWLQEKVEQAFLAGSRDAFAFTKSLLRQMREERVARQPAPPCGCRSLSEHQEVCEGREGVDDA